MNLKFFNSARKKIQKNPAKNCLCGRSEVDKMTDGGAFTLLDFIFLSDCKEGYSAPRRGQLLSLNKSCQKSA